MGIAAAIYRSASVPSSRLVAVEQGACLPTRGGARGVRWVPGRRAFHRAGPRDASLPCLVDAAFRAAWWPADGSLLRDERQQTRRHCGESPPRGRGERRDLPQARLWGLMTVPSGPTVARG